MRFKREVKLMFQFGTNIGTSNCKDYKVIYAELTNRIFFRIISFVKKNCNLATLQLNVMLRLIT